MSDLLDDPREGANEPEFTVSEISSAVKRTIEGTFDHVRIRGEVGRVVHARSGHLYFDIKDDRSVLGCTAWKGQVARLTVMPEEGMEIIATGRLTTFPGQSKYQMNVQDVAVAGEGALMAMLEKRKKQLEAEGLFAPEHKQPLPAVIQRVGIVTSRTGAALHDILTVLKRRFPAISVILYPVQVQGADAPGQIINAIETANRLNQVDVLIVGRGGGSIEDLWPFNEESVVRAAFESEIPLISAVGHETDTTLADFAADLRAPTPTGAAEMAVPIRSELRAQITESESRLLGALNRMLSENRHKLDAQSARLGDPSKLLDVHTQKLDHEGDKLGRVFDQYLSLKKQKIIAQGARLREPKDRLREALQKLERWGDQLIQIAPRITENLEKRLEHTGKMLEAYSFENVLERGFALVQTPEGKPVTGAEQTKTGQSVQLRFKEQKLVDAVIGNVEKMPIKKAPKKVKNKPKAPDNTDQKSLF